MSEEAEKLYFTVIFVQELLGATILLVFYYWLRSRKVKDPTLLWLFFSLVSWSAAAAARLIFWNYQSIKPLIPFIISPVSSILLTMTAFQFSRVREVISHHNLQSWRKRVILSITIISCVALLLVIWGWMTSSDAKKILGMSIDATASTLALMTLGAGLAYSFYKYGNKLLIGLTAIDLIYIIWRQFDLIKMVMQNKLTAENFVHASLNVASYTTLTMIFIALAVAWSLSDASRLKRVGLAPRIKLIAMIFDLRRSTQWFRRMGIENSDYIGTFMDESLELALNYTSVLPYGRPNLIKFLGDGYMFIWEVPDDSTSITRLHAVVGAACALHDNYRSWIKDPARAWMDPPNSIGVGVDLGCASRYTFENGSIDYKGSPVDNVAKMQDLARPDGGVVIQANWQLSDELRDKFPVEGQMVIGNECIAVRATGGVKLQARNKIKLVR